MAPTDSSCQNGIHPTTVEGATILREAWEIASAARLLDEMPILVGHLAGLVMWMHRDLILHLLDVELADLEMEEEEE
jgi:hypothetical protein